MTIHNEEQEVEEFNLTARDIPNFNRTPRIDKIEEVIGRVMEENILLKGENKLLNARIERLEMELDVA